MCADCLGPGISSPHRGSLSEPGSCTVSVWPAGGPSPGCLMADASTLLLPRATEPSPFLPSAAPAPTCSRDGARTRSCPHRVPFLSGTELAFPSRRPVRVGQGRTEASSRWYRGAGCQGGVTWEGSSTPWRMNLISARLLPACGRACTHVGRHMPWSLTVPGPSSVTGVLALSSVDVGASHPDLVFRVDWLPGCRGQALQSLQTSLARWRP